MPDPKPPAKKKKAQAQAPADPQVLEPVVEVEVTYDREPGDRARPDPIRSTCRPSPLSLAPVTVNAASGWIARTIDFWRDQPASLEQLCYTCAVLKRSGKPHRPGAKRSRSGNAVVAALLSFGCRSEIRNPGKKNIQIVDLKSLLNQKDYEVILDLNSADGAQKYRDATQETRDLVDRISQMKEFYYDHATMISHFATCPQAKRLAAEIMTQLITFLFFAFLFLFLIAADLISKSNKEKKAYGKKATTRIKDHGSGPKH